MALGHQKRPVQTSDKKAKWLIVKTDYICEVHFVLKIPLGGVNDHFKSFVALGPDLRFGGFVGLCYVASYSVTLRKFS